MRSQPPGSPLFLAVMAASVYHLGVSELGAMQIGGWSDYQTMRKIYTHISEKDKQQSAEKLSDFFKSC